ncbi:MAG TPA: hypothetical protein VHK47_02225 [Polyangia bacterium]|jgi:hypothetical protein|nr:hypothetical protein [Polyangia bacterium]
MRNDLLASAAVAAVLAGGCATKPVYRAQAPVTTTDGVTVAVVGQKCDRRTRRDMNDILDLVVQARLTNDSATPLKINPSNIRLVVGGDSTKPDEHSDSLVLQPGASSDVEMHYHRWGTDARCNTRMSLQLDQGAPPVSFVPTHKDT